MKRVSFQDIDWTIGRRALGDPLLLSSLRHEDGSAEADDGSSRAHLRAVPPRLVAFFAIQASLAAANPLVAEGWSLWSSQKFAEAEEKFAAAVKETPEQENAWNGLGWSRVGQEARSNSRRSASASSSPLPSCSMDWARCPLQKKYDEAEKALLEAAPSAEAAWRRAREAVSPPGGVRQGGAVVAEDRQQLPKDEFAAKMLAASQARNRFGDELRAEIEPRLLHPPWRMDALNQGRLKDAREAFPEVVLKKTPDDLAAANGLPTLLSLGEPAAAKPYFEQCLKANAKHSAL